VPLLALTLAAWLGSSLPAKADEPGAAERAGWSFQLTPYIWGAGLKGDVATRPNLPTAEIDASFGDIIENTDVAFMLVGEARYGRWGVVADLAYLSVGADGTTPGPLFSGVEADADTFFGTLGVTYRLINQDNRWLDLVAGGRFWSIDNDVTFKAGRLPERRTGVSESWIDPVVGLRGSIDLGSGFVAAAYADIGTGASDLTWQIYGGLGYRFNDHVLAQVGYRYLSVDYEDNGFVWDVAMSGPIVGLSIRF
jgi:opacity protein-like surface antigen